jgi:hypothetical protein
MSDPTNRTDPFDDRAGLDAADLDLVPGDPPVPITVWRTPAATAGMSARLAARLLAAYSRAGDVVYDATGDPEVARAATVGGRRVATRPTGRTGRGAGPDDPAALVLTGWPLPDRGVDPVIVLGALRRRLRPGGVLVAVVANPAPGAAPVDAGPLVHAARAARLGYLQHIVAVTAPADGEQLTPPADTGPAPRHGRHLRVHTDLLVFTPSRDPRGFTPWLT